MSAGAVKEAAQQWNQVRAKFLTMILNDAGKEFDAATRTGFGLDGDDAEAEADFAAVRGTLDENAFVRQIREEIAEIARRADAI
jgi:hypothetical protein